MEQWVDGPNSIEPQISALLSCHSIYFSLLSPGGNVRISHTTGVARRHLVLLRYALNMHVAYSPYPKSGVSMASKGEIKANLHAEITSIGKVMAMPTYVRARNQKVCMSLGLGSGS